MHGNGIYKYKNGKIYKGNFNMGKKMNDRIDMYRAWKSQNYGVDPNKVNHDEQNQEINDEIDMNQANDNQNNIMNNNIGGNSVRSDYRNNGFNLGNNNNIE